MDKVTAPAQESLKMIEAIVMLNRTLGNLGVRLEAYAWRDAGVDY